MHANICEHIELHVRIYICFQYALGICLRCGCTVCQKDRQPAQSMPDKQTCWNDPIRFIQARSALSNSLRAQHKQTASRERMRMCDLCKFCCRRIVCTRYVAAKQMRLIRFHYGHRHSLTSSSFAVSQPQRAYHIRSNLDRPGDLGDQSYHRCVWLKRFVRYCAILGSRLCDSWKACMRVFVAKCMYLHFNMPREGFLWFAPRPPHPPALHSFGTYNIQSGSKKEHTTIQITNHRSKRIKYNICEKRQNKYYANICQFLPSDQHQHHHQTPCTQIQFTLALTNNIIFNANSFINQWTRTRV